MKKFILRLDDACEKRDIEKWDRIEALLDKYNIKPLVGIIPHCEDSMMEKYRIDDLFWDRVIKWTQKGWCIALHGYNHVYTSEDGGLNPINRRTEFAGVKLSVQKQKIKDGVRVLKQHNINPEVFFAPSHTFDRNTLRALKEESDIRVISDTIANDVYKMNDFTFVPQQSGGVRNLPFKVVTFCYHPNVMKEEDYHTLESFLNRYKGYFIPFPVEQTERKINVFDLLIRKIYFFRKNAREKAARE